MELYNSGLNAVLYTKWSGDKRPKITGEPLESDVYEFFNIRFRWGNTDEDGSEHMVNTKRYAVEMQVSFVQNGNCSCDIMESARQEMLLMLSYLFMTTSIDNPYLEPLIQSLKHLKFPMNCVMICPFPIKFLTPVFSKNYFFYEGSLNFPLCTEGVKWIVQPEPLAISSRQVKKFRKLGGRSFLPITCNSRPVQLPNGREIFFYD
ncbi:carbonic anhydrase 1-like [Sitophilus oryzae]|uniref:Carbonic anhydrase 1-like n=1 Tax=Sitophilus oryzae TaxID=7048 RepID=A0A6J2XSW9_SITOR|nr:carbonic anhydrase 1-like [Sitophilus oryzae]